MEFLCTTCCKEKRTDEGLLPAIEPYVSARIDSVHQESSRSGKAMLILSGKSGLLAPQGPIPWYDRKFAEGMVKIQTDLVCEQLTSRGATRILFYALPADTPGWKPYHKLMERACRLRRIDLEVVTESEEVL